MGVIVVLSFGFAGLVGVLTVRTRAFAPITGGVEFDAVAIDILTQAGATGRMHLIAAEPTVRDSRAVSCGAPVADGAAEAVFLEVSRAQARGAAYEVRGEHYYGYRVLSVRAPVTGQVVAAVLLKIRDVTGHVPRIDFAWPERSLAGYLLRFLLFGSGHIASATREILRRAEPDTRRRPQVHVGP